MSDIQIQPGPLAISRIVAVIVVATGIVLELVWLLTGGGGELFERKSYLHSYMPDASGLIRTASVQLNGIQIGKISDIRLSGLSDPKKVVTVEMRVKTRYLPAIPVDSTVTITADDLLGDKYLNIINGRRSDVVHPGAELRSVLPIGDQFNSADLVGALKDELNKVDAAISEVENAQSPLGKFVKTEDFYHDLSSKIVSIQETIRKFAHPQSDLGKMIYTDDFYEQMRAPIVALDKQLADIQAGEGQTGHLLVSTEQYDQIRQQMEDLRKQLASVNAGEGTTGQFLHSDDTYQQLLRLVNSIGDMIDSVNSGEGKLGELLNRAELYESLSGVSTEMQQTLGDFRKNPRKYLRVKVF